MSKRKILKDIIEQIQKDPNSQTLSRKLEVELKKTVDLWDTYKRWGTIAVLIASIAYNVLVSLGIW